MARHRFESGEAAKNGATRFDTFVYDYGGAGNTWKIGADRYVYDNANRLRSGTVVQAQGSGQKEEYTYDAADNVLSLSRDGGTPQPYTIEPSTNRFLGNGDVVHDASGQMLEIGPYVNGQPQFEMEYDPFGMQTRFASRNGQTMGDYLYLYGPGDRRLVSFNTQTGERSVDLRGLGDEVLRQYHVNGWGSAGSGGQGEGWAHQKDFLYGPVGVFATRNRSGSEQVFLHKDHLGTPRALTDQLGDLIGRHDYYPFGAEAPRAGQADEKMKKFTGHERDPLGFTDYMLGRTYLYPFMRFATPDPARDGWSLYAYVGNNPVNNVDPDGHVLVTAAQDTIREIAGDAADKIIFTEWGTVDVSNLTEADLEGNEGAQLLYDVATSNDLYVYSEGRQVNTAEGWREMGPSSAENLDGKEDWRFPGGKSDFFKPPQGVASFITVDPAAQLVDFATLSLQVASAALAFHELAEAHGKIELGMLYEYNAGMGFPDPGTGGAHNYAKEREQTLMRQRPNFTQYPAGGRVIRAPNQ